MPCLIYYQVFSKISHLQKISLKFRRRTVIIGRFLWSNGLGTGPVLMWSRDHRTFESRSSGRSWTLKNGQRTTFLLVWVFGPVFALFKSLSREERKTGRGPKEWLVCSNQWSELLLYWDKPMWLGTSAIFASIIFIRCLFLFSTIYRFPSCFS